MTTSQCGAAPPGSLHAVFLTILPRLERHGIRTIGDVAGLGDAALYELFGRAGTFYRELARGQISGIEEGLLKLVCDGAGKRLLGVQVVGEGATELVHVGQVALIAGWDVDAFIDNIFNFPTLAEAYRVAALDVFKQR